MHNFFKKALQRKKNNKKGFTLAELLVVVAIIGILVAISIPIFTAQLGRAKHGTNLANLRSAKVAAVCAYLSNDTAAVSGTYDIKTGKFTPDSFYKEPADATFRNAKALTCDGTKCSGLFDTVSVAVDADGNVSYSKNLPTDLTSLVGGTVTAADSTEAPADTE